VSTETVEIVRELPVTGTGAQQVLVRKGTRYFVVSSVLAPVSGFETLVFPATEKGEVTDWGEVAGGVGMSRAGAIADLAAGGRAQWGDGEEEDQS
jgi:hypothetical protein